MVFPTTHCAICSHEINQNISDYPSNSEQSDSHLAIRLRCQHIFHQSCFQAIKKTQLNHSLEPYCFTCAKPLVEKKCVKDLTEDDSSFQGDRLFSFLLFSLIVFSSVK